VPPQPRETPNDAEVRVVMTASVTYGGATQIDQEGATNHPGVYLRVGSLLPGGRRGVQLAVEQSPAPEENYTFLLPPELARLVGAKLLSDADQAERNG
jgi:hypothetical protein